MRVICITRLRSFKWPGLSLYLCLVLGLIKRMYAIKRLKESTEPDMKTAKHHIKQYLETRRTDRLDSLSNVRKRNFRKLWLWTLNQNMERKNLHLLMRGVAVREGGSQILQQIRRRGRILADCPGHWAFCAAKVCKSGLYRLKGVPLRLTRDRNYT